MELIQWLDLLSVNGKHHLSASNIILGLYCAAYLTNKHVKWLLIAYILCEVSGGSIALDSLTEVQFYLAYAVIYCVAFSHFKALNFSIIKLSSIILIIIFDSGMSIDAKINAGNTSFMYDNYESLFVLIHINCIISFVELKKLRACMANGINSLSNICRTLQYNIIC